MLVKTLKNTEPATFSSKQVEFLSDLEDNEYRHAFMEELINSSLAFQIRRIREARGWTQKEFEVIAGKKQPTISTWENPNYGNYSINTLKDLAKAFDVALLVRFASFSELADWTVDVDPKRLSPPSYEEEAQQLSFAEVAGQDKSVWQRASALALLWGTLRTDDTFLAPPTDITPAEWVFDEQGNMIKAQDREDTSKSPAGRPELALSA